MRYKSRGPISRWTEDQLKQVEDIIIKHIARGDTAVPWKDYVAETGHPLQILYAMSCTVRSRLRYRKNTAYLNEIRERYNPAGSMANVKLDAPVPAKPAARPVPAPPPLPPKLALDAERRNTSTAKLRMAYETEDRLAAIFGGPPPGRSALDEKNGTAIAPVTHSRLRPGRESHRLPTLATRPGRF